MEPVNPNMVILPVFSVFLLQRRLDTALKMVSRNSPRLYNHLYEMISNLSSLGVESDIPYPERKYIIDVLSMTLGHLASGMPSSIISVSLDHILSYSHAVEFEYNL